MQEWFVISILPLIAILQITPSEGHWFSDSVSVFQPKLINESAGGIWVSAILFICFTLIVILRVFDFRRMLQLLQGFFRSTSVYTLYREENALTSRVSVFLLLNFLLSGSLFVWQVMGYFNHVYGSASSVLWIGLLISGAYLFKITSTRVLGFVFEAREMSKEYNYNVILFNKTVGLILFPISLCIAYAEQIPQNWMIWAGIVSWSIMLIYRFIRLVWIGLSMKGVSFLYIILYLCTLEILPFVVIVKVFVGTN